MGLLRWFSLTVLLALIALAYSCGGGSSVTLDDQFQQWASAQDFTTTLSSDASGLPSIPLDTGEAPRGVSTTPPDPLVKLGADYLQKLNAEVDGDSLVMQALPEGEDHAFAYGLYKVEGLLDLRPTLMNVDCLPAGIDQPYFVGLADYTMGRWMWFGPIFTPEYELDLTEINHNFVTHLGNMYFLIVCPPGSGATHHKTTLFFGDPGGDLPGAPHHLIASDGEFDAAVGLVWEPGNMAGYYEIWRCIPRDPNPGVDGSEWGMIGTSQLTEYLDETVEPNVVYAYKVRAHNDSGFSEFSNVDTGYAGTNNPPPPDGFVIEGHIGLPGGDPATNGEPAVGVVVKLLGLHDILECTTNVDGNFRFAGLPAGKFIVVPCNPEMVFDPWYKVVEIGPDNPVGHADFAAQTTELAAWRAWGFTFTFDTLADGTQRFRPMAGVVMAIVAGDHTYTTETNADGFYQQMELPVGGYSVTPGFDGYTFQPGMLQGNIDGQHMQPPMFFRGVANQEPPPPPPGSGVIEVHAFTGTDPMQSSPLVNLPVMLLGAGLDPVWAHTDEAGNIRWGELPFGTYIVAPYAEHLWFEPRYARVTLNADHPGVGLNFRGFEAPDAYNRLYGFTYGMQGDAPNHFQPLGQVAVTLQRYAEGQPVGEPFQVYSNGDGFWLAENIDLGTYLMTPGFEGWHFIPEQEDGSVTGNFFPEFHNFRGEHNVP